MDSFRDAAVKVLSANKQPLHYKEITRRALEKGLIETHGATPEATMNSQIILDIRKYKNRSSFIKTAPSTYAINLGRKFEAISKQPEISSEVTQEEKILIEGGFTGKGGEHLVCSELLFRGFNASIMSVDVGMDIVATKDNKLYGVQVKTSNLNRFGLYVFDVRKVSFERHNTGNVYYIFVLRGHNASNFLILPFVEMEKKVYEKAILPVGHGKRYRVNVKFRENKIYLGNKRHEMNYFLNNWALIK